MTKSNGRSAAGSLAGLALLGALLPPRAPAQVPLREFPTPQEFVAAQDDNLFSLPRSQEDIHALEQALQELKDGKHTAAVERLHRLLQTETGGVVPVGPNRFLGLRLATIQVLANLPAGAAEAYQNLVRREAGSLLRLPFGQLSQEQLQVLAERYPSADIGRRARQRLGDLATERGDGIAATGHMRALLDATRFGSVAESSATDRLLAASVLQRPRDYRRGDQQPTAVGDVLEVLPAADDAREWSALGGGGGGRTPMADPVGTPSSQWTIEVIAPGFEYDYGPFAMQAIGDLTAVFVNTGVRLLAYDPLRKQTLWMSPAPLELLGEVTAVQRGQYEGAINQDTVLSASCSGDTVVAHLQVPEDSSNVDFRSTFRIISRIPERRLHAFNRTTGKLLWAHFDTLEGALNRRFRGHGACGPPLAVGDTVYAPVHDRSGAIAFSLAAYDLRTGAPRWRRLICSSQQEVNMFGNARSEFASSPICAQDGVIYGCSNLGVAYAVEMTSGRLRWVHAYEVTELPQTRIHDQPTRFVYFANNAPVVTDGVMACTPLDSRYALGIDVETGRALWRLPYNAQVNGDNHVHWLLGANGGEFLFSGQGVIAARARPSVTSGLAPQLRQIQSREFLSDRNTRRNSLPRPALSSEFVYYPSPGRLSIFDTDGDLAPHSGSLRVPQPSGNLLLVEGMVVSLRNGLLDFQYDAAALLLRAEARLRTQQDDPEALLRLAMLRRAILGETPDAAANDSLEDLFRRGLTAAVRKGLPASHPLRQELARELFTVSFDRARTARNARRPEAESLLRSARDLAPDAQSWIRAQIDLFALLADDRARTLEELDQLQQRCGDQRHTFPDAGALPAAAWVLWRRALITESKEAIAAWQELLERFPDERIGEQRTADLAMTGIARWIERSGPKAYAAIEARAAQQLAEAGNDGELLRSVAHRFPHSAAAGTARSQLLDLAAEQGNLTVAAEMLGLALRDGTAPPGWLRRAMAAANKAGNLGLAQLLAQRLLAEAPDTVSDFGPDNGQRYRALVAELQATQAVSSPTVPLQVPSRIITHIKPRNPPSGYRLPVVLQPPGFPPPVRHLVYAAASADALLALDPTSARNEPEFELQVNYVESLVLCGRVLVVPDLSSVSGHDSQTGEKLWQLPDTTQRIYECLGVRHGVLHMSAQAPSADSPIELLGLEPLTGRVLFRRELPTRRYPSTPRSTTDGLLLLEVPEDGQGLVHRLDPLTGRSRNAVPIAAALSTLGMQPDVLASSRLFPQTMSADGERIFLVVDGHQGDGTPTVGAVRDDGSMAWQWRGTRGRRLAMAALRGDRFVVVEAGRGSGQIAVLQVADGAVIAKRDLGDAIQVLNWQRTTWLFQEAPQVVAVLDRAPGRRLTGFAMEADLPSFQQALAADDGEGVPAALVGPDFLTFVVRPAHRGPVRAYCLRLSDRRGALPDERAFHTLLLTSPYGVGKAGPYTVISSAEGLAVLGDEGNPR